MERFVYGIDFGTSNSTITAINKHGDVVRIKIDPHGINPYLLRSVIYIDHQQNKLFGQEAVNRYIEDIALGKISRRKKVFTGKYIKVAGEASASGINPDKIVPEIVEIEEGEGGRLLQSIKSILGNNYLNEIVVFGKSYSIEEITGLFLKEMKKRADKIVGENVTNIVLGRPVEFVRNNNQKALARLEKAAKMAGFKKITFEYEPVGAAYDYGIDTEKKHTALMFDFGGGTLDLTIMKFPEKEVVMNTGISLGGDYINSQIFRKKLAEHFGKSSTFGMKAHKIPDSLYQSFDNWYAISLMKSESFLDTLENISYKHSHPDKLKALKSLVFDNLGFSLYEEIDRVKRNLSASLEETLKIQKKDIDVKEVISRLDLEKIIAGDLTDIDALITRGLKNAKLKEKDIDIVATTGGSSLIPVVIKLLEKRFGKEKMQKTDAFTSVSTGLALRAKEVYWNEE